MQNEILQEKIMVEQNINRFEKKDNTEIQSLENTSFFYDLETTSPFFIKVGEQYINLNEAIYLFGTFRIHKNLEEIKNNDQNNVHLNTFNWIFHLFELLTN